MIFAWLFLVILSIKSLSKYRILILFNVLPVCPRSEATNVHPDTSVMTGALQCL